MANANLVFTDERYGSEYFFGEMEVSDAATVLNGVVFRITENFFGEKKTGFIVLNKDQVKQLKAFLPDD